MKDTIQSLFHNLFSFMCDNNESSECRSKLVLNEMSSHFHIANNSTVQSIFILLYAFLLKCFWNVHKYERGGAQKSSTKIIQNMKTITQSINKSHFAKTKETKQFTPKKDWNMNTHLTKFITKLHNVDAHCAHKYKFSSRSSSYMGGLAYKQTATLVCEYCESNCQL